MSVLSILMVWLHSGYKTCALTNNWLDDKEEFHLLMEYFDVIIESCKVGLRKPNPLIYLLACEELEALPSQV